MKVEFNDNSYTIGHRTRQFACTGCIIIEGKKNLDCPADSEGECILPIDKIYTGCCSNQVFKL
jgi:hypothetical protein